MKIYKYCLKKKFIKLFYNLLKNKGIFFIIKILDLNFFKKRIFMLLKDKNSFFFKFKIQRIKSFFPINIQKILISNLFFLCFKNFDSFFQFIKNLKSDFDNSFLIYLIYYEKRFLSIFYLKYLLEANKSINDLKNLFFILNSFKIELYFKIIKILLLNNIKNLNLILINGNNKSSK